MILKSVMKIVWGKKGTGSHQQINKREWRVSICTLRGVIRAILYHGLVSNCNQGFGKTRTRKSTSVNCSRSIQADSPPSSETSARCSSGEDGACWQDSLGWISTFESITSYDLINLRERIIQPADRRASPTHLSTAAAGWAVIGRRAR